MGGKDGEQGARGKGVGGKRAGPPPRIGGQRVEKKVDRGNRGKGARVMAAGWGVGNPGVGGLGTREPSVSRPRDRGLGCS